MAMGHVDSLSPGEAKLTSAHQLRPPSINRAWDYWVRQVEKAGLMPAGNGATGAAKSSGKTAAKTRVAPITKTGVTSAARRRAHSAKRPVPKSASKSARPAGRAKRR
jgi:hypothetical protein